MSILPPSIVQQSRDLPVFFFRIDNNALDWTIEKNRLVKIVYFLVFYNIISTINKININK